MISANDSVVSTSFNGLIFDKVQSFVFVDSEATDCKKKIKRTL